jgi:signal transduction histidine kinase
MPQWKQLATPARTDLAIAAGLLAWGLPDVPWWWGPPGHAGSAGDVLGSLALTLTMSVPFCWRRRFPLPVLGLALAVLAIRAALHRDLTSAFAAVLVAAYGLGAYAGASRRYARWLGWLALATAVVTAAISNGDRFAAAPFALLAAALVLGDAASARRAEAAAAVEAAHQAERTRIARELHDVVAHQLSAIAVQAGAARVAAGTGSPSTGSPSTGNASTGNASTGNASNGSPSTGNASNGSPSTGHGNTAQVLATVERLAREALTELNHLLGALRREPAGDPARPPAPTLAGLPALVATAGSAGVPARLTVEGPPRPLSPGVELSSYRIVAEALANVARHAPGAPATVLVRYRPAALDIEIRNGAAAHPAQPGSGGRGVQGMRERAELYGGELAAGARPGGGFAVTATIPIPEQQP